MICVRPISLLCFHHPSYKQQKSKWRSKANFEKLKMLLQKKGVHRKDAHFSKMNYPWNITWTFSPDLLENGGHCYFHPCRSPDVKTSFYKGGTLTVLGMLFVFSGTLRQQFPCQLGLPLLPSKHNTSKDLLTSVSAVLPHRGSAPAKNVFWAECLWEAQWSAMSV